jgi:hypothetical protein
MESIAPGKPVGNAFVSTNTLHIFDQDPNSLWVIDTAAPFQGKALAGGPKVVKIDLRTDSVARIYPLGRAASRNQKEPFFRDPERLKRLHAGLVKYAYNYGWRMEGWAVFPNHYHFVAHAPDGGRRGIPSELLADFRQHAAASVNRLDGARGRKVWHNFWRRNSRMKRASWPVEIRASKRDEARPGAGGEPVSVVQRRVF